MKKQTLIFLALTAIALAIGCSKQDGPDPGSGQSSGVTPASDIEGTATPPIQRPDSENSDQADSAAGFDAAQFTNADDFARLMDNAGPLRLFPKALSPEATPDRDIASRAAEKFLGDSRVLFVTATPAGWEVQRIVDFCDNGVRIDVFPDWNFVDDSSGFPNTYLADERFAWDVLQGDENDWNSPYVGNTREQLLIYLTEGVDKLELPKLVASTKGASATLGSEIFVYDYPECEDPGPVLTASPVVWDILGLGAAVLFEPELFAESPALASEKLTKIWDSKLSNVATFDNLNGDPVLYFCDDHQGVELYPSSPALGMTFEWTIEPASDVANNAIWIKYAYHQIPFVRSQLLSITREQLADPRRNVVAAYLDDCSVSKGIEFAKSVKDQLELRTAP